MIKKYLNAEIKSVNKEEGSFEVVASSGKVDRLGDTIDPKGWYLKNYKKNPVILWSHSTGGMFAGTAVPPVGKADKVWIENEKELKIKGHFADTPFAQELKTLVEGGFLNAVSVGFLPLVENKKGDIEIEGKNYRRVTDEEVEKGIYDSEYGEQFTKQELLEVSWVSVPALPQALISARKMNLELVTKALEKEIEENPEPEKPEEPEEPENPEPEKPETPEVKKELTTGQFDKIKNFILETEEAISVLKEVLNPETNAFPKSDIQGRKPFVKQKSKKSDKSEMERLLIMFDKMCEALLRKLRQNK